MLSLVEQLFILFWLTLTGMILGLLFHLYSHLPRICSRFLNLLDLLFLFLLTGVILLSLYWVRWGEVRLMYLLMVLAGFFCYRFLLLSLVCRFLFWMKNSTKRD